MYSFAEVYFYFFIPIFNFYFARIFCRSVSKIECTSFIFRHFQKFWSKKCLLVSFVKPIIEISKIAKNCVVMWHQSVLQIRIRIEIWTFWYQYWRISVKLFHKSHFYTFWGLPWAHGTPLNIVFMISGQKRLMHIGTLFYRIYIFGGMPCGNGNIDRYFFYQNYIILTSGECFQKTSSKLVYHCKSW